MYQIAAAVWNRVAAEQSLASALGRQMFHLSEEELEEELERMAKRLRADGVAPIAVSAFLQMAPLLWEKDALAAFVADHPQFLGAMPNVETVDEALRMAALDRPMHEPELRQLRKLLQEQAI